MDFSQTNTHLTVEGPEDQHLGYLTEIPDGVGHCLVSSVEDAN